MAAAGALPQEVLLVLEQRLGVGIVSFSVDSRAKRVKVESYSKLGVLG
jgi:hypothetical protein